MANSKASAGPDGCRVVSGLPLPAPTSAQGWLQIGRALIDEVRQAYCVPEELHTLAVGWTDIAALRDRRFIGGSRAIRDFAALPTPSPYIVSPRSNGQFLDHAEQDVVNGFIDAVESAGIDPSREQATLWIFVSHGKGPCAACLQGFDREAVSPGILLQLSQRYADLMISLGWETDDGKLGHLSVLAGHRG